MRRHRQVIDVPLRDVVADAEAFDAMQGAIRAMRPGMTVDLIAGDDRATVFVLDVTTPVDRQEPDVGARQADPSAPPCPRCGHSSSAIIVTAPGVDPAPRPHTCCGHPDCMTEDAVAARESHRPPRGKGRVRGKRI